MYSLVWQANPPLAIVRPICRGDGRSIETMGKGFLSVFMPQVRKAIEVLAGL